jgi:nucleoside-diphosphate-sugar epimerase
MMDFVFINDVCDALATAIQRIDAVSGEVINVGSGTGTPLTLLADEIASEISTCPGWTTNSERAGDVSRYVSDISKAGALLDFEPSVDLSTGISSTIDWYMNRQDLLASLRPTHDGADAE